METPTGAPYAGVSPLVAELPRPPVGPPSRSQVVAPWAAERQSGEDKESRAYVRQLGDFVSCTDVDSLKGKRLGCISPPRAPTKQEYWAALNILGQGKDGRRTPCDQSYYTRGMGSSKPRARSPPLQTSGPPDAESPDGICQVRRRFWESGGADIDMSCVKRGCSPHRSQSPLKDDGSRGAGQHSCLSRSASLKRFHSHGGGAIVDLHRRAVGTFSPNRTHTSEASTPNTESLHEVLPLGDRRKERRPSPIPGRGHDVTNLVYMGTHATSLDSPFSLRSLPSTQTPGCMGSVARSSSADVITPLPTSCDDRAGAHQAGPVVLMDLPGFQLGGASQVDDGQATKRLDNGFRTPKRLDRSASCSESPKRELFIAEQESIRSPLRQPSPQQLSRARSLQQLSPAPDSSVGKRSPSPTPMHESSSICSTPLPHLHLFVSPMRPSLPSSLATLFQNPERVRTASDSGSSTTAQTWRSYARAVSPAREMHRLKASPEPKYYGSPVEGAKTPDAFHPDHRGSRKPSPFHGQPTTETPSSLPQSLLQRRISRAESPSHGRDPHIAFVETPCSSALPDEIMPPSPTRAFAPTPSVHSNGTGARRPALSTHSTHSEQSTGLSKTGATAQPGAPQARFSACRKGPPRTTSPSVAKTAGLRSAGAPLKTSTLNAASQRVAESQVGAVRTTPNVGIIKH